METYYPIIGNITRVEYGGELVVTTAQLAEFYECKVDNIGDNFRRNEGHFVEGKHFFKLEGDELRLFKNYLAESGSVGSRAATLYLWTKRGAARHAKMLSTEQAWEVFEQLEDTYFNRNDIGGKAETIPNFERGVELAKLAPHAKDSYIKQLIVAKAANLILGYDFLPIPGHKPQVQLTLFNA